MHTTIQTNGDDPFPEFLVTTNPQQNMVTKKKKKNGEGKLFNHESIYDNPIINAIFRHQHSISFLACLEQNYENIKYRQ